MTEQEQLAADLLSQVVPIGEPPADFVDWVHDKIATRPSPAAPPVQPTLADIDRKLDEILTLLRGGET